MTRERLASVSSVFPPLLFWSLCVSNQSGQKAGAAVMARRENCFGNFWALAALPSQDQWASGDAAELSEPSGDLRHGVGVGLAALRRRIALSSSDRRRVP